jgi:hypothetical protein
MGGWVHYRLYTQLRAHLLRSGAEMSKHTPGPWSLDQPGKISTSIIGPDGEFVIAGEGDAWMVPFACRDEAVANATLVAAAPDLLAAAKEALSYIRALYQTAHGKGLPSNNSMAKQLRDAIAKAEGES